MKFWELGNVEIAKQTGKVPKTFFCVQCGKRHTTEENMHYYNPQCHAQAYKKTVKQIQNEIRQTIS